LFVWIHAITVKLVVSISRLEPKELVIEVFAPVITPLSLSYISESYWANGKASEVLLRFERAEAKRAKIYGSYF